MDIEKNARCKIKYLNQNKTMREESSITDFLLFLLPLSFEKNPFGMQTKNIGTFPHKVYSYYTKDSYGNISLNKLLPLMLDSAGSHAEELGFSKDLLISNGYTWVLSRVNITLENLVSDIENIYIDTWIQKVTSAFSIRVFEAHNGAGTRLAYGTTYWSIINTETRRITPIQRVIGEKDVTCLRKIPCELPQKLVFDRGKISAQVLAQYSDLDYNQHVNSNRYLEWGLNTLNADFLTQHTLTRVAINYNHEVYRDNIVTIYKAMKQNAVELELYNKTLEQTACKIYLGFTAKDQ